MERKAFLPTSDGRDLRPPGRPLRRQQVRERRPAQGRLQGRRMPAAGGLPAGPRRAVLLQGGQGRPRPARSQLDRRRRSGRPPDDAEEDRHPAQRRRLSGRRRAVARRSPAHPRLGREPGDEGRPDGQARAVLQPPPARRRRRTGWICRERPSRGSCRAPESGCLIPGRRASRRSRNYSRDRIAAFLHWMAMIPPSPLHDYRFDCHSEDGAAGVDAIKEL